NNLPTTVSASGFTNLGTGAAPSMIIGAGPAQSATFTVNGSASNSGTLNIGQFATLALTGGNVFTQTPGTTSGNGGTLPASQINIGGGGLFFETALTGVDGTGAITLSNGGNAEFAASVAGTGPITLTQGSLAEFAASVDSSEQVGFGGGGTIQ